MTNRTCPRRRPKLPDATIAEIGRWIDLGAPYDRPLVDRAGTPGVSAGHAQGDRNFWSFRPLTRAPPPAVRDASWVRTPIDRFIASALDASRAQAQSDRRSPDADPPRSRST